MTDCGQDLRQSFSSKFQGRPLFPSVRPYEPPGPSAKPLDVPSSAPENGHPTVRATGTRQILGNLERRWR